MTRYTWFWVLLAVGCAGGSTGNLQDTADHSTAETLTPTDLGRPAPETRPIDAFPVDVVDARAPDILDAIADLPDRSIPDTDAFDVGVDLFVEETLEDAFTEVAEDITFEVAEEVTDDVAEEVTEDIAPEVAEDVAEEVVAPCEVGPIGECPVHFFVEPTFPVVQDGVWVTGSFTGWAQPGEGALPMSLNDTGTLWQLDVVLPDAENVEYKFLMTWPDNSTPTWVTQDWDFQNGAPNSTILVHCGETACQTPTFIHTPRIQWPGLDGFWILFETDLNVALTAEVVAGGMAITLVTAPEPPQIFWLDNIGQQPPGYQHRLFVPTPPQVGPLVTVEIKSDGDVLWTESIMRPHLMASQRLAVYGDTRTGHEAHQMVVDAVAGESPDAVIVTGDFVDIGVNWDEWEMWAAIEEKLLQAVFWLPVYGNHEVFEGGKGRPYLETWFQTDNRYRSGGNYWLDMGHVGFVAIDPYHANFAEAEAKAWLDGALAGLADKPWLIVAFHEPYYSFMGHPPWTEGQTHLEPLFIEHGVDLVLNGHDHAFEHFLVNDIHYIVAGGGGAPLSDYTGDPPPELTDLTVAYGAFYHYVLLDVTATELTAKVVQLPEDQMVDEFTLVK